MGIFKSRPPWTPADIPNLSFTGPTDYVDIGFLGGDEHRDAFTAIFAKMLHDNEGELAEVNVVGLDAKRPIICTVSFPVRLLDAPPEQLARELYDSHNERVFLRLSGPPGTTRLGMTFDDPSFWLE
jgi:hypothetical protein